MPFLSAGLAPRVSAWRKPAGFSICERASTSGAGTEQRPITGRPPNRAAGCVLLKVTPFRHIFDTQVIFSTIVVMHRFQMPGEAILSPNRFVFVCLTCVLPLALDGCAGNDDRSKG